MAKTLYWYWVHYCYAEGLTRSSERAKLMLMFLFYGVYLYNGKKQPIIHAIRRSVMSGRYRFAMTKHKGAYDFFAAALDTNPDWDQFLDDKGKSKRSHNP